MRVFAALLLLGMAQPLTAGESPGVQAEPGESHETPPASASSPAPASEAPASTVPAIATAIAGPQLTAEDLRPGTGQEATPGSLVAVHYTGWLQDAREPSRKGRQFDSSRGRRVFVFPLGGGRVIKGWDLGVAGMKVGGLRRLIIPPELAYGSRDVGRGLIPPDSTLIFEVELLGVESVKDTPGAK